MSIRIGFHSSLTLNSIVSSEPLLEVYAFNNNNQCYLLQNNELQIILTLSSTRETSVFFQRRKQGVGITDSCDKKWGVKVKKEILRLKVK